MNAAPHPEDFEQSDADPLLIAALAAGIWVFLAASPLLLRAIYPSSVQIGQIERGLPSPRPPILETKPKLTLQAQRSREDAELESYGWANRNTGIARIPIERAMQLLAERGLPGWPPAATQSSR